MTRARFLALAIFLTINNTTGRAEVSCSLDNSNPFVVQMSIDPTSSPGIWQPVGLSTSRLPLNESGVQRGDIEPAVALNKSLGRPHVAWQFWDGQDFEIAFSDCIATSWTPPSLLSDNGTNDVKPSISVASDGAIGVTWIDEGTESSVKYREYQPGAGWSSSINVGLDPSTESTPSLVFFAGVPKVALIEPDVGTGTKLIVASGDGTDPWPFVFEPEIIAQLSVGVDPEPELFAGSDRLVATWIDSTTHIGFAALTNGVWSAPQYEPYAGSADLGKARVRAKVRALRLP